MFRTLADTTQRPRVILGLAVAFFTWQLLNGLIRPLLVDAPLWFWVTDVAFAAALPGLLLALVWATEGGPLFVLPASVWRGFVGLLRLLGWFFLGVLVTIVVMLANDIIPKANWAVAPVIAFDYASVMPSRSDHAMQFKLALVYLSLSAAVFEEWFYRRFLDQRLAPIIPGWQLRVCATGALFGLVHWEAGVYAVCNAAALGALFALLVRATGKLTPAIVVHFTLDVFLL